MSIKPEVLKPVLEHLPLQPEESFVVKKFDYPFYPTPWHFHPEYELVLVLESTGKRFIGDSISDFKLGDMAFIGPNLPHLYRNDTIYYQSESSAIRARSIVIHFLESSFGENFLSLPEAKEINALCAKSIRGLEVTGQTKKIIEIKMHELCLEQGFARWLNLLEILQILSESKDLKFISHTSVQGKNEKESDRMNKIFEFVMKNFHQEIEVNTIAQHVNLAENSFSRYFSQRTRKPFTTFVNEIRVSHACKLLRESQKSVLEICYESGFNNLSNFNRQFKNIYQLSPLTYRKQFDK